MNPSKCAFIFPGQGESHSVGMGKDFYDQFPVVRELFQKAQEITGIDLVDLIFNGPLEKLSTTDHCQLAIYLVSVSILKVIQEQYPDITPHCVAGLSLGEYTAATAAGVLSFEQGIRLVHARGQLMQKACNEHPSTMAVVLGLTEEQVQDVLKEVNRPDELWIANLNCPGQIVVSGTHEAIEAFMPKAKDQGAKRVLPLNVAGAFHSPFMQSAADTLQNQLGEMELNALQYPLFMNAVGDKVEQLSEVKKLLIQQITQSVRWQSCIEKMQAEGVTHFIEIGPGKVLAGLNKRIKVEGTTDSINTVENLEQMQALQTTNQ